MVEIHVYGKLRRYAKEFERDRHSIIALEPSANETIASLLGQVAIPVDEIHHIFFNSTLLATHNSMAAYLDYPQSRSNLFDWELDIPVSDGDRIGLFGRDMALLGM